jgi:hypothetical protein
MRTEAQKRAQARYEKSGAFKRVEIKLNKKRDEDIIKILEHEENVSGYIKSLIRKDKGEG